MTQFRTQLNRSVMLLHHRKIQKYQHIFDYRPVSFYAVYYCTDALCIKDGVKIDVLPGEGYVPVYTRIDLTDTLHDVFGFRTDYQITSQIK